MANYVKISTIGTPFKHLDEEILNEAAVKEMLKYLQSEVDKVLPDKPDLIVLPEACDRPCNYNIERYREYYKARGDKVLEFFGKIAGNNNCNIVYNTVRHEPDGSPRNSTRIIGRDGKVVGTYNKNHPVIVELEEGVQSGSKASLIECDFGRVACVVCFDLIFDELRLKYVKQKPDLVVFTSMFHGGLMQNYWAYSCRSWFVGSVISDKPSTIISPVGEVIASSTDYFGFATTTINLDYAVVFLDYNQDQIVEIKKKYGSRVKVSDPGHLGAVLITSESDEFTMGQIVKEFGLELIDDYIARSQDQQRKYMER